VRIRLQKLAYMSVNALLLLTLLLPTPAHAQAPGMVTDLAARINRERVSRGLAPYALNAQLTRAAQSQASDIAGTGDYSHTGSDGSTVFDRVARTAFGSYSWGRRLGENWAWYPSAATAMSMWMDSAPHRANILHPLYREIGIGIAPSRGNTIFVVDFGVEPNVLPLFIDGIDGETHTQAVTLTLTSEDVMPNGDGPKTIGRATQLQLSNTADFAGAHWQPFAQHIPWTLSSGGGTKTVYVKYRDAAGRIATSSDSIVYIAPATRTPTPLAPPLSALTLPPPPVPSQSVPAPKLAVQAKSTLPTQSLPPTATATATPADTATLEPTQTETAVPTPQSSTPTPSPTPAVLQVATIQDADPFMLGGFCIAIMLIALAFVKYLFARTKS
jgi:hypothetical protein